ncbi:alpha/beta-hydrolase [Auricularia subglabra TFB-10046 SS5]|nr:alpha/beta-hydrolase [Auricularia subglabra TFB-10046 SS5]
MLAKMTSNAYYGHPGDKGWYDLGDGWNNGSYPVGWEPDSDGFRGHVFATPDNSTVVLSIKGTTVPVIGGGGPTGRKDKLNDNLLFSCCCAKVGPTWSPVCGCHAGGWKCDSNCVQHALEEDSLFYSVGTNLYNNLTYLYPRAEIWLVGHSLGGSLAALLGATFGAPVVAFEAPAERMAAQRLHLPLPPDLSHITHVFHNADPIPMGTCTGVMSACASAGYAMEGKCHLGRKIVYDTVGRWNWGVSVRTHLISVVIEKLLADDWDTGAPQPPEPGDGKAFRFAQRLLGAGSGRRTPEGAVPRAVEEDADCPESECYGWEFGDWLNSSSMAR